MAALAAALALPDKDRRENGCLPAHSCPRQAPTRTGPTNRRLNDWLQATLRAKYGFLLLSFAVMPDHVHLLLLPAPRNRISDVARFIKGAFARKYNKIIGRMGPVWQASFFERVVRSERALREIIEYIDENPVKAGWLKEPQEYAFCSANPKYETDLLRFLEG